MPSDFVHRWTSLANLAATFGPHGMSEGARPFLSPGDAGTLKLKDESDYVAYVRAATQIRSRSHERLVRVASERLRTMGATIGTAHPIDLRMTAPVSVLFEAKIVGKTSALFAVRDAVGQLLEYSHFVGPSDALLCLLLDERPDDSVVRYIEDRLSMFVIWLEKGELASGLSTKLRILDRCAHATRR